MMDGKQAELMRSLTAAQAALWDVIDDPHSGRRASRVMLSIIVARVTRLANEITGLKHGEN